MFFLLPHAIIHHITQPYYLYVLGLSLYREDAVSFAQFPTEISWTSRQNEGNEDSFSILPSNNVEAETCRPSLEHHPPGFPDKIHATASVRVKLTEYNHIFRIFDRFNF